MNGSVSTPLSRMFPICLLLLLLAFPALSVQGAADGLTLWFQVVLPTLAPFIICTQLVVSLGAADLISRPFYPLVHRWFGLSGAGTYILLCGLLCGYPLGAKLCADFLEHKKISREEADHLLIICNHPSPMFLLGFVRGQLPMELPAYVLPLLLYLPVIPISVLYRLSRGHIRLFHGQMRMSRGNERLSVKKPYGACGYPDVPGSSDPSGPSKISWSMEDILLSTAETMVLIGGYIMLFSILAAWIRTLPFVSAKQAALLSGIAEITTGVRQIAAAFPPGQSLLPAAAVTAFGGLSGIFQTKSVIKNAGLSIRHYLFWKLIHMVCTGIITLLLLALLPRAW